MVLPYPLQGLQNASLFTHFLAALMIFGLLFFYKPPAPTSHSSEGSSEVPNDNLPQLVEKWLQMKDQIIKTIKSKKLPMQEFELNFPKLIEESSKIKDKAQIWFSSNSSKVPIILAVAKSVLEISDCGENYHQPTSILNQKFDLYGNCFRSISIEFHNRLSMLFDDHQWFTMVTIEGHGFMITTMHSKRNEYLFSIGKIMFQVIEYEHILTMDIKDDPELKEPNMNDNRMI